MQPNTPTISSEFDTRSILLSLAWLTASSNHRASRVAKNDLWVNRTAGSSGTVGQFQTCCQRKDQFAPTELFNTYLVRVNTLGSPNEHVRARHQAILLM